MLEDPTSPWWDDRTTSGVVEGRDDVLARALVNARHELAAHLGSRTDDWAWGKLHVAAPEHPVLGGEGVPGVLHALVNPRAQRVGGGSSIVDATAWDAASGSYAVTAAPSMRMVVDLGDLDSSTWVNLTGTSGHPASVHYADQLEAWARGEQFAWPYSGAAVEADAVTARAVAALDKLYRWTAPLVREGGTVVAMKGARAEDELTAAAKAMRAVGLIDGRVHDAVTIPGTEPTRVVTAVRRVRGVW